MTENKEQYVTVTSIHHNQKLYKAGVLIELTEAEAIPLLKEKLIAQGVKGIATSLNENNALKKAFEDGVKEGLEKASGQITDQLIEQIAMDDEYFDRVLALRNQIDKDADLTPPETGQLNPPLATPAVEPVTETPDVTVDPASVEAAEPTKAAVKKGKK